MSYATSSFQPGQSFLDTMRATGVSNRGQAAGSRWPGWRTWHIGAPGTTNFRFGNYEYVAPNDTSRANARGTGTGSNLNRALYRYGTLKSQNPGLSDEEAWNQAVQWIIKHDVGKKGADYTGFRAITPGVAPPPNTYVPPASVSSSPAPTTPQQPVGPPPSAPGATSPSPPPGGGTPPVSYPGTPVAFQPGDPQEVPDYTSGALPPGWRYNPMDVSNENYGLAMTNAFRQGGFNAGVDNPWFKFAQDRLQGLAPFMNIMQAGGDPSKGDVLATLEDMAKGYLGRSGGTSPLNYQTFVNMLQQMGSSGSDMQRAVLGPANATTGGYDLPVQDQYKSLLNLIGGGAGLTMNPMLARALVASLQAGYGQYQNQPFQQANQGNLISYLLQNNPTLRRMMGQ